MVASPARARAADFGGDGLLAFVRPGPKHVLDVFWQDLKTGKVKNVTAQYPGQGNLQPTFSPEGGPHLAFVTRDTRVSPGHVFWVPFNPGPSSKEVEVSFHPSMDDSSPSFSSGGGGLVYSEADWRNGQRVADGAIMQSHLTGGVPTQLTGAGTGDNITPAWSPDTDWIVFASNRGTGRYGLWIMQTQGEVGRNLKSVRVTASGTDPQWAPDSRSVVYEDGGAIWAVRRLTDGSTFDHIAPTWGEAEAAHEGPERQQSPSGSRSSSPRRARGRSCSSGADTRG